MTSSSLNNISVRYVVAALHEPLMPCTCVTASRLIGTHGDIQFIVNTDGHQVVQFVGISCYSFNTTDGLTYDSGDTITLDLSYFLNGSSQSALPFSANGIYSPVFEFDPGESIGDGSTLGGYFQIVNDAENPLNSGSAAFDNNQLIPEPSVLALVGLGCATLLIRRRL